MLPYRDSRLTYAALAAFFVIVLGYALFEARGLIFGPRITIPATQTRVEDPVVDIAGRAERISALTMNGQPVPVTEEGAFEQTYLLAPGYNRIVLDASDRYGRTNRKVLEIVYVPREGEAAIPLPSAAASTSAERAATESSSSGPMAP